MMSKKNVLPASKTAQPADSNDIAAGEQSQAVSAGSEWVSETAAMPVPHTTGHGGSFRIGDGQVTRTEGTENHPDGNRARPNLTTQGDK